MKVIIVIDEAQYLRTAILNDFKIIFNFNMDSKNYASVILLGLPTLNDILTRSAHEALRQRIVVNYQLSGLSNDEAHLYVNNALKQAGNDSVIFTDDAINTAHQLSKGSFRVFNNLLEKSLIIGANQQQLNIDNEIIRLANIDNELN